jgi:hypothetical protein
MSARSANPLRHLAFREHACATCLQSHRHFVVRGVNAHQACDASTPFACEKQQG